MNCPECKNPMHKAGMALSGRHKIQRFKCPKCGRTTVKKECKIKIGEGKRMKTIKIEFGLDTATVGDIDSGKYLKDAARELRTLLPEYRFSCSVNEDDNAETKILNEGELEPKIIERVYETLVNVESSVINQ